MQEVAQNKAVIESNQLYVPVPQKVLRCINLRWSAKIILLDIISHMGYNHYSYAPIEDIALNCGISHATVQANMKKLEMTVTEKRAKLSPVDTEKWKLTFTGSREFL